MCTEPDGRADPARRLQKRDNAAPDATGFDHRTQARSDRPALAPKHLLIDLEPVERARPHRVCRRNGPAAVVAALDIERWRRFGTRKEWMNDRPFVRAGDAQLARLLVHGEMARTFAVLEEHHVNRADDRSLETVESERGLIIEAFVLPDEHAAIQIDGGCPADNSDVEPAALNGRERVIEAREPQMPLHRQGGSINPYDDA